MDEKENKVDQGLVDGLKGLIKEAEEGKLTSSVIIALNNEGKVAMLIGGMPSKIIGIMKDAYLNIEGFNGMVKQSLLEFDYDAELKVFKDNTNALRSNKKVPIEEAKTKEEKKE